MNSRLNTDIASRFFIAFSLCVGLIIAPSVSFAQTKTPPKQEKSQKQNADKNVEKQDDVKEGKKQDEKPQTESKTDKNSKPNVGDKKNAENKSDQVKTEKNDTKKSDEEKPKRSPRIRNKLNKENSSTMSLFAGVISEARLSTVEIMQGRRRVALGTIIDNSGLVLTKASELRKPLTCKFSDGRVSEASVIGVDPQTDLALLRTTEQMLPKIAIDLQLGEPEVGNWIAVPGASDNPLAIGVVSVANRKIPAAPGFMGIQFAMNKTHKRGVVIEEVRKGLPADNAGLKDGDVLFNVEGIDTPERQNVVEIVMNKPPGSKIVVKVLRGKEEKESIHEIILGNREKLDTEMQRANFQNTLGNYRLSDRRKNFPTAFRHDGFLKPDECGGPIVNLDGKMIGINIARGGRVESLALPNSIVLETIEKLKTGDFTPAVVNKAKIEIVKEQLAALKKVGDLDKKKQNAGGDYETQDALVDELKAIIKNIQKRLDEAEAEKSNAKEKLDTIKQQMKSKLELEKQLQMLTNGIK